MNLACFAHPTRAVSCAPAPRILLRNNIFSAAAHFSKPIRERVTLVVATTTDPASIGPASALLAMPGWHPGPSLQVSLGRTGAWRRCCSWRLEQAVDIIMCTPAYGYHPEFQRLAEKRDYEFPSRAEYKSWKAW